MSIEDRNGLLGELIPDKDRCLICRSGSYPTRDPSEPFPDPNDRGLCRRCGSRRIGE